MKATVRVRNTSPHPLPQYATEGSAGLDVRAFLQEPYHLGPWQRYPVPTGLFLEIPPGFEIEVRPRSGLAFKHGLTLLNTPGTIDSDYRGELKILLVNLSEQAYTLHDGERIAQLILSQVVELAWEESASLAASGRDVGGFGHTGNH